MRELCRQRGVDLLEGYCMADHIHMCLSIPPKYSVSHTIRVLKGKSAVRVHRALMGYRRMTGLHFWATGYWVSTVCLDEDQVRLYIRNQEKLESGQGDLDLKKELLTAPAGPSHRQRPLPGGFLKPRPLDVAGYYGSSLRDSRTGVVRCVLLPLAWNSLKLSPVSEDFKVRTATTPLALT